MEQINRNNKRNTPSKTPEIIVPTLENDWAAPTDEEVDHFFGRDYAEGEPLDLGFIKRIDLKKQPEALYHSPYALGKEDDNSFPVSTLLLSKAMQEELNHNILSLGKMVEGRRHTIVNGKVYSNGGVDEEGIGNRKLLLRDPKGVPQSFSWEGALLDDPCAIIKKTGLRNEEELISIGCYSSVECYMMSERVRHESNKTDFRFTDALIEGKLVKEMGLTEFKTKKTSSSHEKGDEDDADSASYHVHRYFRMPGGFFLVITIHRLSYNYVCHFYLLAVKEKPNTQGVNKK